MLPKDQTHRDELQKCILQRFLRLAIHDVYGQSVPCELLYKGVLFIDRNGAQDLVAVFADVDLDQIRAFGEGKSCPLYVGARVRKKV